MNQKQLTEFTEKFGKAIVSDKDGGHFIGSYLIEFIEKVEKESEFKVLQDFMGFLRNGHNLKPGDFDNLEGEYALFQCRYYMEFNEEYLKSISQPKESEGE